MTFCADFYEAVDELSEYVKKRYGLDVKEISRINCNEKTESELRGVIVRGKKPVIFVRAVCDGETCRIGFKFKTSAKKKHEIEELYKEEFGTTLPEFLGYKLFGDLDPVREVAPLCVVEEDLKEVERCFNKLLKILERSKVLVPPKKKVRRLEKALID
ncbi:hypothetical protein DRP04_11835 [Archaeoglobales archaeon]|nr:MAG: hypothetical protein DRP04_11835 [Archaeoglobales archaeon]